MKPAVLNHLKLSLMQFWIVESAADPYTLQPRRRHEIRNGTRCIRAADPDVKAIGRISRTGPRAAFADLSLHDGYELNSRQLLEWLFDGRYVKKHDETKVNMERGQGISHLITSCGHSVRTRVNAGERKNMRVSKPPKEDS